MLVERLLKGERVTYHGRYNTLNSVQINVLPVQSELPLHVAVLRKEAAYHVGRQGRRMMCVPYASVDSFDEIGEIMAEYRRGREEVGLTDHRGMAMMALHTHVAESDAEARRVAANPFDLYVATRLYAKSATYDDIVRNGLSLFGSPDTAADKLLRLHEMGVDHVLTLQSFGLMPREEVERSIRMLAQQVMPRLADRIPDTLVA